MTQEDKELLLKDLCARLPYGVKCKYNDGVIVNILSVNFFYKQIEGWERYVNHTLKYDVEDIKPYLFPLSSMTEEQMFDFATVQAENCKGSYPTLSECSAIIDWGYKHHFDVNNLIEKGLALDATGLNVY